MERKYYTKNPGARRYAICLALLLSSIVYSKAAVNHFVVTSTADPSSSTSGTLRWAINQANVHLGDDNYVDFNISGSGTHVIALSQGEIYVQSKTMIDGVGIIRISKR